ncbi:MAG: hypothetical protein ND807_16520 [Vicinamibacterales bacterium]|nr:hypothetical protein [Vicinamibacterales bacterium]
MKVVLFVVLLALLGPSVAIGQVTTADAISAIAAGDDRAAAQILQPLTENTSDFDPLAAFFLATLYHAGKGVAHNEFRACGLYLRAAVPPNPFLSQSLALAKAIHNDHPVGRDLCVAASQDRWNEPSAATFSIAPDHWVRIDSAGFVVGYGGNQKPVATTLGGAGWVFLPTKLTELDVASPAKARRHFIEFLVWMPQRVANKPAWMLLWFPYEIVGVEAIPSIRGGIEVATADQPSTEPAVADAIHIRGSADGGAEWVVDGPTPRNGPIPSPEAR